MRIWSCLAVIFAIWAGAGAAAPLVVFAAASLKEPMDALAAQHGDVVVSYGGSGALARQILHGAPADVVVLAHPQWMDVLGDQARDRVDLLSNRLVLVGPPGEAISLTPTAIRHALEDGRLATGLTEAVPAGQYAAQSLRALGLWEDIAPRLAEVDSVRAALILVARQEVPLGVVYATDALADPRVTVRAVFPEDSHDPILYPAARLTDDPRAAAFLDLLRGPLGQKQFEKAGFVPLMAD